MLVNCWLCWLFCYVNCVDCVNYVDNVDNVDNVSYVGELLMLAVAPAWGIAGVDSRNTPNWIIPRGSILFLYLSLYLFLSDQIQPFSPFGEQQPTAAPIAVTWQQSRPITGRAGASWSGTYRDRRPNERREKGVGRGEGEGGGWRPPSLQYISGDPRENRKIDRNLKYSASVLFLVLSLTLTYTVLSLFVSDNRRIIVNFGVGVRTRQERTTAFWWAH